MSVVNIIPQPITTLATETSVLTNIIPSTQATITDINVQMNSNAKIVTSDQSEEKENKVYTWDEIKKHNTRKTSWLVYENKVYDTTKFLEEHPGGEEVILEQSGTDATDSFNEIGHTQDALDLLQKMYIGRVEDKKKDAQAITVETKKDTHETKVSDQKINNNNKQLMAFVLVLVIGLIYHRYF